MSERWIDPAWDAELRRELARATSDWHAEPEWTAGRAARSRSRRLLSLVAMGVVTGIIVVGALVVHSRVGNAPRAALPEATTGIPMARSLAAAAYDPLTGETDVRRPARGRRLIGGHLDVGRRALAASAPAGLATRAIRCTHGL